MVLSLSLKIGSRIGPHSHNFWAGVARCRKTKIFKMELMTKICVNYQHFKHSIGFVHNTSARRIF
jgi:hypothetical protein